MYFTFFYCIFNIIFVHVHIPLIVQHITCTCVQPIIFLFLYSTTHYLFIRTYNFYIYFFTKSGIFLLKFYKDKKEKIIFPKLDGCTLKRLFFCENVNQCQQTFVHRKFKATLKGFEKKPHNVKFEFV